MKMDEMFKECLELRKKMFVKKKFLLNLKKMLWAFEV